MDMPLERYKEKRTFGKTPEPTGGKPTKNTLQFVVQKHAASHLHYDFRLELRGVLKSWAVPKGPSMNPEEKHLAMLVEDHPFDYKDFEGIIPPGNYGAGTVLLWDQGTYLATGTKGDKKAQEHELTKQFYAGAMKITLKGKKLKGDFILNKMSARGENAWLLTKVKDKYGRKTTIRGADKSVASGKTMEQLSTDTGARVWHSNRKAAVKTKVRTTMQPEAASETTSFTALVKQGVKAPMPNQVSPMLCTLTKEPIDDNEYLHEIKWDGYRIIAYVRKSKVRMDSRSGLDYTKKYPPIANALKALKHDVVLDGEAVVFNEEGLPDFDAVHKYNGQRSPIYYCAFDLLWIDGYDLTGLPLSKRKTLLEVIVRDNSVIRYSESYENGPALYKQMIDRDLEGIVSKRKNSLYRPGDRGNDWLKTPTRKRQEFVIGGWAESEKNRAFRSLLFGAFENGKFVWIGRSGGGYKEKEMPAILRQLKPLEIKTSPFVNKVLDTKGATIHWVKPELIANFAFATWTKKGRIRKPATFLGFRNDKKARQVVREIPKSAETVEEEIGHEQETKKKHISFKPVRKRKLPAMPGSNWPELEKILITSSEDFEIGDCTITLTNVEREIWPGITKASLIEYYHEVAPYLLPYLKDRPLSLHTKPYGWKAQGLYIKDMEGREPACASVFRDKRRHETAGKRRYIDYLVCNNEATLLYAVNLGCIDINPWMSRIENPAKPDFVNIDLDPSDDDFSKVIEVAKAAKQVLDNYRLKSFIKTSGKTGMHIYLPVKDIKNEQARVISQTLNKEIHLLVPDISTVTVSRNQRDNKVFIDFSQNDYADTLAAPYSVRPNASPTVSTPLDWKEVKRGLDPRDFTIHNILKRIEKKGDLFEEVLNEKWAVNNGKVLEKIF